jgi:DnaJ-class molecular chaperone
MEFDDLPFDDEQDTCCCPDCDGSGFDDEDGSDCPRCGGLGYIESEGMAVNPGASSDQRNEGGAKP